MTGPENFYGKLCLVYLHELGVTVDELAWLTGESEDRLTKWLLSVEPAPSWLIVLAAHWKEMPILLERAREICKLTQPRLADDSQSEHDPGI